MMAAAERSLVMSRLSFVACSKSAPPGQAVSFAELCKAADDAPKSCFINVDWLTSAP